MTRRVARGIWPTDATPGAMPGTMRCTGHMLRHLPGNRSDGETVFPRGWKPVAFYPCLNAWDIAPAWHLPLLPVIEAVERMPEALARLRLATALALRRIARRLERGAR